MVSPLKNSPVPLYHQLGTLLRTKIEAGELPPGAKLPGERELAEQYGVSSITARGAMKLLMDQKLIERYPGRGTFVAGPQPQPKVWGLGSMDDIVMTTVQSDMQLLSAHWTRVSADTGRALGIEPRTRVYHLRVVRTRDGVPFMLTDAHYPPSIGEGLQKTNFPEVLKRTKLLIEIVETACGVVVQDIRQTMGAEFANEETAQVLGVKLWSPLLAVVRENFTADGRIVQLARSRYRTDKFSYVINLSRFDGRGGGGAARG